MAELMNTSNSDQYVYKPETNNPETTTYHLNRKGRFVRALSVIGLTAAVISGSSEILKEERVATVTETIDSGETPIGAVADGVMRIAAEHDISPNTIHDTVYAGQEVADELGQPIQAGTEIEVRIVRNGLGQYSAEADPVSPDNLAHLTK